MGQLARRGVIGGLVAGAMLGQAMPASATPKVGKPAPKFTVWTFEGKKISLADLAGDVVILNYWATWCGPCRAELPLISGWVKNYQQRYQRDDLKVFAITTEGSVPDNVLKPLAKVLSFPLITKLDTWSYGPIDNAVPTNYIIDRSGVLRYARAAAFSAEALNELLPPLLSETRPDAPVSSPAATVS